MRRPLGTLLGAAILFAGISMPQASAASARVVEDADPAQLYEDGRKAYRLGNFRLAVDKWEQAYDASDNAVLLFNIALGYKGLYGITNDIADLRRSRAVLDNFIKVATANPEIDVEGAAERLKEIETMLEEAEDKAAKDTNVPPPTVVQQRPKSESGPDPGRKLRLAGIGTMLGGGAVLVVGIGVMSYYVVKSKEFNQNLRRDNTTFEADCGGMGDALSQDCLQLKSNISYWRSSGRDANTFAAVSAGVLGGAGVLGLVAGGLLYNEGNKRTKQWERGLSRLQMLPTRNGFVLHGRF